LRCGTGIWHYFFFRWVFFRLAKADTRSVESACDIVSQDGHLAFYTEPA
jgi:hypothetical protein